MIKKDDCVRTPWSLVFPKIQMNYVDRLPLIVHEKEGGNDSYKLDEEIVAIIDILAYKRRR